MKAHPSIRRRLLAMLIFAILAVWVVVLLLVYRSAHHEVEEVFDAGLARSARILTALLLHEFEEEQDVADEVRAVQREVGSEDLKSLPHLIDVLRRYAAGHAKEQLKLSIATMDVEHRYGSGLAFVARFPDGSVMMRDRSAPDIPPHDDGFADVLVGNARWRIYTLTDKETSYVVQVGERHAFRSELVNYITRNSLMPSLVAVPLLAVLIWAVVGRALRPLQRVAEQVASRAPQALGPIDDSDAPHEIHSMVCALNNLFARVDAAMVRERQFTADAAHELRTPLAALKTHLQVARARTAEGEARRSLDQALDGVDRATHSVEQLLYLARADAEEAKAIVKPVVNLRDLVFDVVAAFSQQAFQRDIDLGVDADQRIEVHGDATALHVMLRNLVDNAVRYTPVGGTVTVATGSAAGRPWLEVVDNGAGVSPEDREKIFDRFHRGSDERAAAATGSGLGLSIVQRIADLHGAEIRLDDGPEGRGLAIRVLFPAA